MKINRVNNFQGGQEECEYYGYCKPCYGRIVSRIFEMTEQVPVLGPDYRRKMA